MFNRDQWELLDFGPTIAVSRVHTEIWAENFQVDQFKTFISDVGVESPKRGWLTFYLHTPPEVLLAIVITQIGVFYRSTAPQKLFQTIQIFTNDTIIMEVADRVQDVMILELICTNYQEHRARVFRKKHPKLKIALEVKFGFCVEFKIVEIG